MAPPETDRGVVEASRVYESSYDGVAPEGPEAIFVQADLDKIFETIDRLWAGVVWHSPRCRGRTIRGSALRSRQCPRLTGRSARRRTDRARRRAVGLYPSGRVSVGRAMSRSISSTSLGPRVASRLVPMRGITYSRSTSRYWASVAAATVPGRTSVIQRVRKRLTVRSARAVRVPWSAARCAVRIRSVSSRRVRAVTIRLDPLTEMRPSHRLRATLWRIEPSPLPRLDAMSIGSR